MLKKTLTLTYIFICCVLPVSLTGAEISLDGNWRVSLQDPEHTASSLAWREIRLPGTLDDAGIGEPLDLAPELSFRVLTRLQRKNMFVGPAWYTREVTIPDSWKGRAVILELERVLWKSTVFVDGREYSSQDSLTTPHRFDLSAALTPGKHTLMLKIDNREIYKDVSHKIPRYQFPENMNVAHAYTNHTQIMWNGVLGCLCLRAEEPVRIDSAAVSAKENKLDVAVTLSNGGAAEKRTIKGVLRREGSTGMLAEFSDLITVAAGGGEARVVWTIPENVKIEQWDEFSPALYNLELNIGEDASQAVKTVFGFRELAGRDGSFWLNGKRIFFRGNLTGCEFPLTGYPATDAGAWRKIIGTMKAWGLNHMRFHSWCPPEAAFAAADELGFYFQVELPHWWETKKGEGHDAAGWAFLEAEGDRILREYGNHPSFMLFSLGNELRGDFDRGNALVRRLRGKDPRHLYTVTTFTFAKGHGRNPEPADDYYITQYTQAGWVRGQGIFNERAPAFDADYTAVSAYIDVPMLTHEIGQYAVYPDLGEIKRYTGNLVPLNFIAVRDDLEKKGMLGLAPAFTQATGHFSALLYKEDIERALRTLTLDGFQILQLQDFPGQGTALVGMLNVFWEPKGFITAKEFREFCSETVPLARLPKAVYEQGEVIRAQIDVSNFGKALDAAVIEWRVTDDGGRAVDSGRFASCAIPTGGLKACGAIEVSVPNIKRAARWQLEVIIAGTEYKNRWNIWVYPKKVEPVPSDVVFATTLNTALPALAAGKRVLFNPPVRNIKGIEGKFVPVFWSPVHFPKQPGTMGILCDPKHPALAQFPTAAHSDWQWWEPALRSRTVIINNLPVTPIVRVIDNFARNHSLANIFEAKVGKGSLLFCAIDVTNDLETRPVARQLRNSLLQYVAGKNFTPVRELPEDELKNILESDAKYAQPSDLGQLK
jgi:hypothetical protein